MSVKDSILKVVEEHQIVSSKEIYEGINLKIGYATVKRAINQLIAEGLLNATGKGKATRYSISESYKILFNIDADEYFAKEQDERDIIENFDLKLIPEILLKTNVFTDVEILYLNQLHEQFKKNIAALSQSEYNKEMERLAIDLSWKSSQIEGNTYTLLETERLLRDKETAAGKPKDDAIMLLNHKEALNFIITHPDYIVPLTIRGIEDIHSLLIKDLGVDRNIRKGRVGISGTNYKPLDNEYQIRDSLFQMCELINKKDNVFEKSLLAIVLLSYIQAFVDGNKRTARIVSNAILIASGYCPLSFRTVDSIDYKKAMLIFYEQNNISAFKKIFIQQYEFAINTYF
ncbi:Fic family protein [Gynurincola endophyticus]|uniref:Fic family protein n=1 Tax=Gynurincola endophyticus TaxID=2479004 RepID=UPI000F8F1490|nr:Fic family protein [Gynurincola endophyticus]